jgi:hypothetical protein
MYIVYIFYVTSADYSAKLNTKSERPTPSVNKDAAPCQILQEEANKILITGPDTRSKHADKGQH